MKWIRLLSIGIAVMATGVLNGPALMAQEKSEPEVLLENSHHGFVFALDNKFSQVDGRFANFFGVYGGWLINHQFMIGLGGYGKTTGIWERQMGYGGLVLEYYLDPNRLVNFSIKGLLGGGASAAAWADPFFVAEPEVKMTVNITRWLRIGCGGGYRFVAGGPWYNDGLSGFTASVDLKVGRF